MGNQIKHICAYLRHHLIIVGVLLLTLACIGFYFSVLHYGQDAAANFTEKQQYIRVRDTMINGLPTAYLYDRIFLMGTLVHPVKYQNVYAFSRSVAQLQLIKQRATSHSRVIDYFLINSYYFLIIQILFGIGASILGLVISKKGWADTNPKVIAIFLVIVGFLLFFQLVPKGMKFEDNLAANKAHYLAYCDLENRMLTYMSDSVIIAKYNKRIDRMLKTYHSVSFDLQQIPFAEIQKQFEEITNVADGDNKTSGEVKDPPLNPQETWTTPRDRAYREDSSHRERMEFIRVRSTRVEIDSLQKAKDTVK